MATNQKSRSAILHGAKLVIADVGTYQANMIDIAAKAEVSRATVYNHFSDKSEMFLSLLESEIVRLINMAQQAPTPADGLYELSCAISTDLALAQIRQSDPADLARLVSKNEHPLWRLFSGELAKLFGTHSALVEQWLIGQIGTPLSQAESRAQADRLVLAL